MREERDKDEGSNATLKMGGTRLPQDTIIPHQ